MAPDPPAYPVEERSSNNYDAGLAVHNSDDSDNEVEEQEAHDGYTLLGQHEHFGESVDNDEDFQTDQITTNDVNSDAEQCESEPLPTAIAGRAELAALWNSSPSETSLNSIAMDDERSAQIRAAMSGFSLPPSAVPAWASNIPEEMWKERLLGRLHQSIGKTEPSK